MQKEVVMKNKSLGLYNLIDSEGINKSINNVYYQVGLILIHTLPQKD